MEKQIEDFYRSLRGRRVAFIGTGVTNQQCIELFARCGAQITLCDKKPDIDAFGPYAQALRKLDIRFSLVEEPCRVEIQAVVSCTGVTGVEMEALTAVSVAALTIYDM